MAHSRSASHGHPPVHSRLLVAGTVSFYLVAALAMVMANKWVLNNTAVPIFFLGCQLVIAVFLFLAARSVGVIQLPLNLDPQICKALIPMVSLSVVGLMLTNYTLKYVDASFYQVARGLVLPFTVLTSYVALHARPSLYALLSCGTVTFGFFVGVFFDGTQVSLLGVCFGVASSMVTAVHSVVIKRSLDVVQGNTLLLSFYSNLLSAVILVPIMIFMGEVPGIFDLFFGVDPTPPDEMSRLSTFLLGTAITGVFGFLMSLASLLSIKVTSPITHMVSSAVRGVAASLLGVWLFQDIITTGRASSIATILVGSILYTWVKHQETSSATSSKQGAYDRVALEDAEEARSVNKSEKPEGSRDPVRG